MGANERDERDWPLPAYGWAASYLDTPDRGRVQFIDGAHVPNPLPVQLENLTPLPDDFDPDHPTTCPPRYQVDLLIAFIDARWQPIRATLDIQPGWGTLWRPVTRKRLAELGALLPDLVTFAVRGWGTGAPHWELPRVHDDGTVTTSGHIDPETHRAVADREGGRPVSEDGEAFGRATQTRQRRRRIITPELLDETAKVYLAGARRPLKAVAQHFGCSEAQASRYIAAAKADGKLPR